MRQFRRWTLGVGLGALLLLSPGAGLAEDAEGSKMPVLPRVGTLGQAPSGDDTIVVDVLADGTIAVDGGEALSLLGLHAELQRRTKGDAFRESDRSSGMRLLVNADARVPWAVVLWILQAGAEPRVRIHRTWLGALALEGEARGALHVPLPKDKGLAGDVDIEAVQVVRARVSLGAGPASDPEALLPILTRLRQEAGESTRLVFTVKAPPPRGPAVPAGFVVRVIEIARRAGLTGLRLEGAMSPMGESAKTVEGMRAAVAKLKAVAGVPTIRVAQVVVGDGSRGEAAPPRGLLAETYGFEVAEEDAWIEELEEEEDEEVFQDEFIPDEVPKKPDEGSDESLGAEGLKDAPFPTDPLRVPEPPFPGRLERTEEDPHVRAAIEDALRWLAAHQSPNGGWEAAGFAKWCDGKPASEGPTGLGKKTCDVGVTGLALCAYLGAGYTHRGEHEFARTVAKGLRYLKNVQDAEGCFGARTSSHFIYGHAIATQAMVEAYGMTQSPIFRARAQRAVQFIQMARNPYFAWRYGVRPGDNDTSVTGWMLSAIHAAEVVNRHAIENGLVRPFPVEVEVHDGVKAWLEKMTDEKTGRVGYIQRGGGSARDQALIDRFPAERSEAMTAVGLWLRVLRGMDPHEELMSKKAVGLLEARPPRWDPKSGDIDMVYWYYGTLAMHQVGRSAWRTWSRRLVPTILTRQRKDTTPCLYKGSWDPAGPWGLDGGRVYATALMTLCLETPHRYERRTKR